MPLSYYPTPGEIVYCDYSTGFIPPEMMKGRPVVVLSPRLRRRPDLVAIVPLSTTAPSPIEPHHCLINLAHPLPPPFDAPDMWAKCDMIAVVSKARLDRFKVPRVGGAARKWTTGNVTAADLKRIRAAVLCGLGMPSLTVHL
jgi:mRNA interferase MazF